MPKPFALISSSDIKAQEFFDVLRASGGVIEDTSALAGRISRGEQLAVTFAAACAQLWPCVVYNLRDKVFSAQELLWLQKTGSGFEE